MPSTVKNPWRLVAGTFALSLVLLIVPSLVFGPEIKAVNALWYFVALRVVVIVAFLYYAYRTVTTREDDNSGGVRALTIAIAAVYFIVTMAGAAQYRSDKSDGIQFDKKTSQAAKVGVKSWNI